jgi:hypothetical protein
MGTIAEASIGVCPALSSHSSSEVLRSSATRSMIDRLVNWLILLLTIVFIVDGLLPQAQMFLFHGRVLITLFPLKLLYALLLLVYMLFRPKAVDELVAFFLVLGGSYLVADVAHLVFGLDLPPQEVLTVYWIYYSCLLLAALTMAARVYIEERTAIRWIVAAFLVCAPISIAQWWLQRPILPTESSDGAFKVGVIGFLGHLLHRRVCLLHNDDPE